LELLKKLYILSIIDQIGVFKSEELLENPEVDNQQPSLNRNIFKGSTTNSRILTDNAEDSNGNTSIRPEINNFCDDIV
jgi:hypothetical protein